jgi:hypothetical protein
MQVRLNWDNACTNRSSLTRATMLVYPIQALNVTVENETGIVHSLRKLLLQIKNEPGSN